MTRLSRTRPMPRPAPAVGSVRLRLPTGVWVGVLLALLLVQLAGLGHRVRHPAPHWQTGWQVVMSQDLALGQTRITDKDTAVPRAAGSASHGTGHDEAKCRLLDALSLVDAGPSALVPLVLLAAACAALPAVPVVTSCIAALWRRQARAPPL